MRRNLLSKSSVREYSSLVTIAVEHGVSFNDIMHETVRAHGNEFTLRVLDELGQRHGCGEN